MKRILFLDIDGVLNSLNYFNNRSDDDNRPYPFGEFDLIAVQRLNHILCYGKVTDLVISSDWRHRNDLQDIFTKIGIQKPFCNNFSITPCNIHNLSIEDYHCFGRGTEIKDYLSKINEPYTFCIIDDSDQFLSEQKSYVVLTNYKYGLRNVDVRHAIEILKYS